MPTRGILISLSGGGLYRGGEVSRRVAVCRERLRRSRATQRMTARAAADAAVAAEPAAESHADSNTCVAKDETGREP